MLSLLLATALAQSPRDLVRVDDPDHPDAVARSASGAVLLEPPAPGTAWSFETVPHVEAWVAEEAWPALNLGPWHDRGARGQGVKIAVFDLQWFGAADPDELGDFTTHDCWADPSCDPPMDVFAPRFSYEEGVHGYACAEIVHDIAPEAELHLVRVNGPTTFENAVDWAVANDIDIVSISMSFFNNSFYDGTGPVARQVEKLVGGGVLLVASAGNYAERHWVGPWRDANGDGRMDFDGDDRLRLWLEPGGRSIYLSWNQHRSCGKTDLDAILYDPDGNIAFRADRNQAYASDQCDPVERIRVEPEVAGWYALEVSHERGATADLRISVLAPGGQVEHPHPGGGIPDPGAHPWTLTVGAIRAGDTYRWDEPEPFSSQGPTYGGWPKPDLAGPDGLSTSAFGSQGFFGTSAATPAVAATIAVVQSEDPGLDAFAAADKVKAWALSDDTPFGQLDPRWGHGRVRLPEAPEVQPCGRRPLVALFLLPIWAMRRRHRCEPR